MQFPNPRRHRQQEKQQQQHDPQADTDGNTDGLELLDEPELDVGYGRAPNPCKVSSFKDTTTCVIIESWFYQMEDYMELNGIPHAHWVKTCIANFNTQHYDQVHYHRHLPYREFKRRVIEIFKRPDMTQYKIKELWTIKQYEDEAPDAFLTRIRAIAREAFRKLPDNEQQVMTVHAFCEGLRHRVVAALVATQARNSAARAVRIAAEAIAVNSKDSDFTKDSAHSDADDSEYKLAAAERDAARRGKKSLRKDSRDRRRNPANLASFHRNIQCYKCQGQGHMSNVCPSPGPAAYRSTNEVICSMR